MINIAGSAKFSFLFPAVPEVAFDYFSDMQRIAQHLRHIELVAVLENGRFRMRYATTELKAYDITIWCDVVMACCPDSLTIQIIPQPNDTQPAATLNGTISHGIYQSAARFEAEGDQTRIHYSLTLKSDLPRPHSMRLMPRRLTKKIANGITSQRLREIVNGFIQASLDAFPRWQEETAAFSA